MPVIFSTPETGFALGAGVFLLHRTAGALPDDRPKSIDAIGFYTTKKQTVLAVEPELFFRQDTWRLWLSIEYTKIPRGFYGVGPNTPESDKEDLTREGGLIEADLTRRVYRSLRSGVFMAIKGISYTKKEEGGNTFSWDGTGEGSESPAGIYLARFTMPDGAMTVRRIVLIR